MTATTVSLGRVEELILARLLPCGNSSLSPKKLRDDLARFFRHPPGADQWQTHVSNLVEASLLTVKPYRLTEAGRARALEFIGVERLPPRASWSTIRARFLVPKALGLPADAATPRKRSQKAQELLSALVIRTHFDVPVTAGVKVSEVLEALVCKRLGFPQEVSLEVVQTAVLAPPTRRSRGSVPEADPAATAPASAWHEHRQGRRAPRCSSEGLARR
jgi:hypothetical protein